MTIIPPFPAFVLSTVERAAWTFIQSFLGMTLIDPSQTTWKPALIAAGIAGVKALSVGMSAWNFPNSKTKATLSDFLVDTTERTVWTFVQSFLGAVIATGSMTGSIAVSAVIAAGIAAGKSFVVSMSAQNPLSTTTLFEGK